MDKKVRSVSVIIAALSVCAGIIFLIVYKGTVPARVIQNEPSASDLWSVDSSLPRVRLLDVDLDPETQWAIFRLCGYDSDRFCFLMAIAEHESGFQTDLVGDGGRSLGMMQINTKWHTERLEALGVTDLMNPVQCAAVAVDYLHELESRYGFEPWSEGLLMSYNMGPGDARKALGAGKTSTDYSRTTMAAFQKYLEEWENLQSLDAPAEEAYAADRPEDRPELPKKSS